MIQLGRTKSAFSARIIGITVLAVFSVCALNAGVFAEAQEKVKKSAKTSGTSIADTFRCEKMRNKSLKDLKAKLVENCDLDKPFSFSTTDIGVDSDMTYCCHGLASTE